MSSASIAGYTFGAVETPRSPLSTQDFDLLKKTVLFTDDDIRYLHVTLWGAPYARQEEF